MNDIAVVGAPFEDTADLDAGAAYVLARDQGGPENWGEVKKLVALDAEAGDYFGISVAISGDLIVVGAYLEDAGDANITNAGAAYVFARNQGGTDNWGDVKKLTAPDAEAGDQFGVSVAISGDLILVGAGKEDSGGLNAGAAYVFARDQGGANNWGEVKKILASDAEMDDFFGNAVAISGNVAVVGADSEDEKGTYAGAAYVFTRNQGGTDNWGEVKKLLASDAEADDFFGYSVAISRDIAVVGADSESTGGNYAGAAYVFARNQGGTDNWGEVRKLMASDAQAWDRFGSSVGISGNIAIVGSYMEDDGGSGAGAAYVFARNEGGEDNWGEMHKLMALDATAYDNFGYSVGISNGIAVVGAYNEGSGAGAAYVYK